MCCCCCYSEQNSTETWLTIGRKMKNKYVIVSDEEIPAALFTLVAIRILWMGCKLIHIYIFNGNSCMSECKKPNACTASGTIYTTTRLRLRCVSKAIDSNKQNQRETDTNLIDIQTNENQAEKNKRSWWTREMRDTWPTHIQTLRKSEKWLLCFFSSFSLFHCCVATGVIVVAVCGVKCDREKQATGWSKCAPFYL